MARQKKQQEKIMKAIIATGKRKTAIAKAKITSGTGLVTLNKKPIQNFNNFHKLILYEPFEIAKPILGEKLSQVDIIINVSGSGVESQIEAARLAIARALLAFTKNAELRSALLKYDRSLLVADIRRKEQRKPNDSKARARRQKSYR
jgi:small subunit ribosomal protein S9